MEQTFEIQNVERGDDGTKKQKIEKQGELKLLASMPIEQLAQAIEIKCW